MQIDKEGGGCTWTEWMFAEAREKRHLNRAEAKDGSAPGMQTGVRSDSCGISVAQGLRRAAAAKENERCHPMEKKQQWI